MADVPRHVVVAVEFAIVDRVSRLAQRGHDLPAAAIDWQDVVIDAVRDEDARLSDRIGRDAEASGREGDDRGEEVAVHQSPRQRSGRTVGEPADADARRVDRIAREHLLQRRVDERDIRRFVFALEGWMIAALGDLGIAARREPGRIGIWTGAGPGEAKIGAIGVRVRRWVTMHGFAINVAPDLGHFDGIVPCGIADYGVTSLSQLGASSAMSALDAALLANFPRFISDLAEQAQGA